MNFFYSKEISSGRILLDEGESRHCVKVLRHSVGDEVMVSGGDGNLYRCTVAEADPRRTMLDVVSVEGGVGGHPYHLHIAVAPTKNIERFEWFIEKATEIGVDEITPLLCDHSERKEIKPEREERLLVAAAKQSLKSTVPLLRPMTSTHTLFSDISAGREKYDLLAVAFCDRELVDAEGNARERVPLTEALRQAAAKIPESPRILILIGPEGDFSRQELDEAAKAGLVPISLGESRLRTETAALVAVAAVSLSVK